MSFMTKRDPFRPVDDDARARALVPIDSAHCEFTAAEAKQEKLRRVTTSAARVNFAA